MFAGQSILEQVPKSSSWFRQISTVPRFPSLILQNSVSTWPSQHFCRPVSAKIAMGNWLHRSVRRQAFSSRTAGNVPDKLKSAGFRSDGISNSSWA